MRWARPWCIATRFSLRVSIQRIGRPSLRATVATMTSSTARPLPPKPPPTSGAITRTFSASRPIAPARPSRSACGVWLDSHTVSRPSSHTAVVARGSSGATARRWLTSVPSVTTSQPSKSSSSVIAGGLREATFVPTSSNSSVSSFSASRASVTAGSGS